MKLLKLSKLIQSCKDDKIESCASCPFNEIDEYDNHFCYLGTDITDYLAFTRMINFLRSS